MTRTGFSLLVATMFVATFSLVACEASGEFRIAWSFTDGSIQGAGDCSRRGVERVVITFSDDAGSAVRRFEIPCGRGDSGVRSVPVGTYQVRVQAFGPARLPFVDYFTGEVTLLETLTDFRIRDGGGVREGAVVFTPNPECADGVDNDGDGLVDANDPGCLDKDGQYDPIPSRTEEGGVGPGTVQVTWTLNGGRDTCAEVQPDGAAFVALMVNGLDAAVFSCDQGNGSFFMTGGIYEVALRLLDAEAHILAETGTQDATVIQDLTTALSFDVGLGDFDPPQTGQLQLTLSWVEPGMGCGDASPVVENQALVLRDADQEIVEVVDLEGYPWDGSQVMCLEPTVIQGPEVYLPAGQYTLAVAGFAPTGGQCWSLSDALLQVDLGPNPAFHLVVPQTEDTGLCAP